MSPLLRRMRMLVALALLFLGCQPTPGAVEAPPPAVTTVAPAEPPALEAPVEPAPPVEPEAPARPPPLDGERLIALEVPGFASAVVSVPLGARAPRPILVATHGNFDRPEWQCMVWGEIVGARSCTAREEFGVGPHGRQRRAQLVGGVRDEPPQLALGLLERPQ